MEIDEIKQKIMEKIEDEKSKTSRRKKPLNLDALSARMGKPKEELLRLFNKAPAETATIQIVSEEYTSVEKPPENRFARLNALEEENAGLKKIQIEARSKSDELLRQIEEKDRAIAGLQKKLASESISLIQNSEKEKSLINTAIEKSISEYRNKLTILESENEELKTLHSKELKQNEAVFFQIDEKDKEIAGLKKKFQDDLDELGKDKESAIEKSAEEYKDKISALENENKKVKKLHEDSLRQNDALLARIEEKDARITELEKDADAGRHHARRAKDTEKALEEHRANIAFLDAENKKLKKLHEEAEKMSSVLEKKLDEECARSRKLKDTEKALEEHRANMAAIDSENKKLKKLHEEAEKTASEIEKRAAEELSALKSEKDKSASNMESMRSKLYAAAKETKEQAARITQLEEMLKHRDKKLVESEKVYKNLEKEKNGVAANLEAAGDIIKSLESKMKALNLEIDAKEKHVSETERLCRKNIEIAKKEADLLVQTAERNKKALEGKISQLNIELDAKNKRIEETEGANIELDNMMKESAMKLQAAESAKADIEERTRQLEAQANEIIKTRDTDRQAAEENIAALKSEIEALKAGIKEKEKSEEGLRENITQLESEIEARDKKIQMDTKYCEDVVREVNDLRQKIKAYRLKAQ